MSARSRSERLRDRDDVEQSLIGSTVNGKYRIRRVLGSGAMGIVCEAQHVDLGKRVALKLISQDMPATYETVQRFRREARAASAVESDHVVQIFDIDADDDHGLYLVMELLHGEDLATRLNREVQLEVAAAVDIARQAALGLSKLHAAGVVHRDLKPANVFLSASDTGMDRVKLLDFGVSKVLHEAAATTGAVREAMKLTRHGEILGTPLYMSPEQARGDALDHRTDLFSLGVIFFEMLAGTAPHPRGSYEQLIAELLTGKPRPLLGVAPWVPPSIAAVVHRALERDIEKRFESARQFVDALDEAVAEGAPADDGGRTIVADSMPALSLVPAPPRREAPRRDEATPEPEAKRETSPLRTSSVRRKSDPAAPAAKPAPAPEAPIVDEDPDEPAEIFSRKSISALATPAPQRAPSVPDRVVIADRAPKSREDVAALEAEPTILASAPLSNGRPAARDALADTARRRAPTPRTALIAALVAIVVALVVLVVLLAR